MTIMQMYYIIQTIIIIIKMSTQNRTTVTYIIF